MVSLQEAFIWEGEEWVPGSLKLHRKNGMYMYATDKGRCMFKTYKASAD